MAVAKVIEISSSSEQSFEDAIDETRAVEPLERTAVWELGEPPETYPSAL